MQNMWFPVPSFYNPQANLEKSLFVLLLFLNIVFPPVCYEFRQRARQWAWLNSLAFKRRPLSTTVVEAKALFIPRGVIAGKILIFELAQPVTWIFIMHKSL